MNILIVDDHPVIADAYETFLHQFLDARIIKANNCTNAINIIDKAFENKTSFELFICDHNLPPCPERKINNGADIVSFIKKAYPLCKTILITAHSEFIILYEIIKKVKPHGLLLKSDIDSENFRPIVTDILNGNIFYSKNVEECLKMVWKNELIVDDFNREILTQLGQGYKIKELEQTVNLSESAIRKRIARMRDLFGAEDERDLIKIIIKQGFL